MNKTCLITGANRGIGFETSLALAKMGFCVLLVCKNEKKGKEAQKKIIFESKNKKIELITADLSNQKDIYTLINLIHKFKPIDILINNAAVITKERLYTKDNIEMQFAVNYLAPFLLNNLIIHHKILNKNARIINITSNAHRRGKIDLKKLLSKEIKYNYRKTYAMTKLALIMHTYELSKRLNKEETTVNCVHPGMVYTPMLNTYLNLPKLLSFFSNYISITPCEGSKALVHLATSNKIKVISGKYFVKNKLTLSSKESYNTQTSTKLWEVSKEILDLDITI